ncbi:MAG: flagellar biosynthetic protein FliP [Oxalobacteraceae bacterium]|nr:flagellar biosynthetic protein FliP [Oxalobacteraceae bacterium]
MMETASASVIFLLLVAVVAIAVGLVARQWRRPQALGGLQVLSTTPLGQRERLVEVLHGDEILVLGVTHQSINLLDRRKASVAEQERLVAHRGPQRSPASARFLGTAFVLFFAAFFLAPTDLWAQSIPLFEAVPSKGGGTNYSVPVQTVLLLTALSFLPAMLMLMTSFTRILIVLSLLRQAMGLVTTPPNAVLIGLALFITAAVMAPVTEKVYADAWQPYVAGRINFEQAIDRGVEPVKSFMLRQTRADDLNLFVKLSGKTYAKPEDVPLTTVIPAFAISEIRTAFLIGFVIYLPFLAIDFAVASILTALGMVMVSPITFSLPLKLIVFVLADGWAMLIGGLVDSFKMSG